jgi:hypothetical protein
VSNHGPYSDLSECILQHMYMILEDHALTDSNQRGSREGNAGGVVDSLYEKV